MFGRRFESAQLHHLYRNRISCAGLATGLPDSCQTYRKKKAGERTILSLPEKKILELNVCVS